MRSPSYKSNPKIILSLILSAFTPVAGGVFLDRFLSDWSGINESMHSIVESMGIFIVIPLSVIILHLQQTKRVPSYYIWVSGGLLSIGVLDLVHTLYDIFPTLGDSLLNRHAVSILVGGSLFILVWLPSRAAQSRLARVLPVAVTVSIIALSVFSSAFPGTLYAIISRGVLAALINGMNSLGGLLFLLAAVFFIIRYRSGHRSDDLLLINFCLLNSGIGLMLQFSQPWHADWWFLHSLRLSAYFIMISYTFIAFLSFERELMQVNTALKAEIVERRGAEEALRKERDNAHKYFNVAGIILIVIGADQKVSSINKKGCELLGYEENEMVGKNWFDTVIPERMRDVVKDVHKKLMTEEYILAEYNETPF